jgi:hypothetical protein
MISESILYVSTVNERLLVRTGSLLYDVFTLARPYSVGDTTISEWRWIEKDLVGSDRVLILRYCSDIRLE